MLQPPSSAAAMLLLLLTSLLLPPSWFSAAAGASANRVAADVRPRHRATTTTSHHVHASSSLAARQTQQREERYEILPSAAILQRMQELVANYPTFATLTTTQEWFGLPRAGGDSDCLFDENYEVHGKGCNNYVLILQDKEAYPDDPDVRLSGEDEVERFFSLEDGYFGGAGQSSGWKYVPDVFLSGSVHGNERVGPSSLLEMSELLAESAYCESLPRMRYKPEAQLSNNSTSANSEEERRWKDELMSARTCRQSLADKGVPSPYRQWLARLVSTRRTIIIPTANALGYSRDERAEDGIDPNRDFPFDVLPADSNKCMQTMAGRSINELFRSHLFPIGLTFHGGMEVIGYEWGAPTYLNKAAPDDLAQRTIASSYSRYANGFNGHVPYDFGTMNDKVYYVRGGMEDWAFAGSWDPDRVVKCTPTTFGGYSPEKTTYNNATLRAFNMLIETSSPKAPEREDLGKRTNPLISSDGEENGHIARNIRLALLAMDVVEPYVAIRGVGGMVFEDDIVPAVNLRRYDGASYFDNGRLVWIPTKDESNSGVKVSWTVGGSFDVDETELVFGPWDSLPSNLADADDGSFPSAETMAAINDLDKFNAVSPSNAMKGDSQGRSRWHASGPNPTSEGFGAIDPTFEAAVDVSRYSPGTSIVVFARAKVDKAWLEPSSNVGPADLGPASHIVNARRNPSYLATNGGKVIRGRVDDWWYSDPITLIVGELEEGAESNLLEEAKTNNAPMSVGEDGSVKAVHINARLGYLPGAVGTVSSPKTRDTGDGNRRIAPSEAGMPWLMGTVAIAVMLVSLLVLFVRWRRRRMYAERVVAAEEDDDLSARSYRDDPEEAEEAGMEAGHCNDDDEEEVFEDDNA